jgi:hypothetical protein
MAVAPSTPAQANLAERLPVLGKLETATLNATRSPHNTSATHVRWASLASSRRGCDMTLIRHRTRSWI